MIHGTFSSTKNMLPIMNNLVLQFKWRGYGVHLKDNANIVVTGGAGFIGSHMAELLLKKGLSVTIFDNLSTGLKDNVKLLERYKRCTFIKADITEGNALSAAIAKSDAVFHFAAVVSVPYSVENPDTCFSVNVSGFENIIAALRGTTKPLFYASSAAVYGNRSDKEKRCEEEAPMPMSPYAASKAINEIQATAAWNIWKIPTFGFRFFNVYGPRQNPSGAYASVIPKVCDCLRSGANPVIFGDGQQTRDFVYVKDVADTLYNVMENINASDGGYIFNLATGKSHSVIEVVQTIISSSSIDSQIDFRPARAGDIKYSYADVTKLADFLGDYRPTDFKDGLAETLEWYMRNGK